MVDNRHYRTTIEPALFRGEPATQPDPPFRQTQGSHMLVIVVEG